MTNPLVSIIIPVYGVEKYIARCARSVFDQTYQNLEIIFVDDCTQDNSICVLKKVMEEYPERKAQVKILKHEYNRGLSAARNTGVEAAMGDYIYFLDSDDAITNDCIETLEKPFEIYDYDFVVGDVKCKGFSPKNDKEKWIKLKIEGRVVGKQIIETYNKELWPVMAWNKLLSKNFLKKNGISFEEGIIHEDELWSFWLSNTAKSIYTIRKVTYNYFFNDSSIISNQNVEKEMKSYCKILFKMRCLQQIFKFYDRNSEQIIEKYQHRLEVIMRHCKKTDFEIYTLVRKFDKRNLLNKLLYYIKPLRTFLVNFHWLLPTRIGWIYYSNYGFWSK